MNDYYSVRIEAAPCSGDITDLAAAFLADVGFESFEPDAKGLTAYINVIIGDGKTLAEKALSDFPMDVRFSFSQTLVIGEDWNEVWEKNYFKPILIDNKCVIHSSFHKNVPPAEYDIVIDPKMAFGTGHHDTTSNMVRLLMNENLVGKSVIDMGTGTGILGILTSMLGAEKVTGIEIDFPAYENALENVTLNKVSMDLVHGDASALDSLSPSDFLLANINRNIILEDMGSYVKVLKPGGVMFLSGFYDEDIPMILEKGAELGLHEKARLISDSGWTALKLINRDDANS